MDPAFQAFLAGAPQFLLQGALALAIWAAALGLYVLATPHSEWRLIRQGNAAAGLSLGAAATGIAIPVAMALASAHSWLDLLLWGAAAAALQLLAFRAVDLLVRGLSKRIEAGEMAAAAVLCGIKLGVALVTAAALAG